MGIRTTELTVLFWTLDWLLLWLDMVDSTLSAHIPQLRDLTLPSPCFGGDWALHTSFRTHGYSLPLWFSGAAVPWNLIC